MKLDFTKPQPEFMQETVALAVSLMNPRMEAAFSDYERYIQLTFCREYIISDPLYTFVVEKIDEYLDTPVMRNVEFNLIVERENWNRLKKIF